MNGMTRAGAAAIATLFLTGCSAIGLEPLEDLNEHEVAKYQVPKPLVELTARVAPEPPLGLEAWVIEVAGQQWQATATEYQLPASFVRQVGTAGPLSINAFAWDQPPYDRLLVATPHGFYVEMSEIY